MMEYKYLQNRLSVYFMIVILLILIPQRYRRRTSTLILIVGIVLTGLIDYLQFYVADGDVFPVTTTLMEAAVLQGMAFALSKKRDFRALFAGLTAAAFTLPGNLLGGYVYVIGYGNGMAMMIKILIHTTVIGLLIGIIRKYYRMEYETRESGWAGLCIIPLLFYCTLYAVAVWPNDIYKSPEVWLGTLLILAVMVMSYAQVFAIFVKERQTRDAQRDKEFLKVYANSLKREVELRKDRDLQLAVQRHDMRHSANMIMACVEKKDYESINQILLKFNRQLDQVVQKKYCDNVAIDGVLSSCASMAEKEKVGFSCHVVMPDITGFDEFEFAIVLSNLVENAVLAASQEGVSGVRFVRICIRQVKSQLAVEISNSCKGKLHISPLTRFPVTESGEEHGYGLRSVQLFVNKQSAIHDYEVEEGLVCFRMLLDL